jgi:hypothetical protein
MTNVYLLIGGRNCGGCRTDTGKEDRSLSIRQLEKSGILAAELVQAKRRRVANIRHMLPVPRNSAPATYYRAGAGYDNHQFGDAAQQLSSQLPRLSFGPQTCRLENEP